MESEPSLRELKEFLEQLAASLVEQEGQYTKILQDTQRWQQLAEVVAALQVPVRELRQTTERMLSKIESLVDQVQLRQILEQHGRDQKELFVTVLDRNKDFIRGLHEEIAGSLREIVVNNEHLIKTLSAYLDKSLGQKGDLAYLKRQLRWLWIGVVGGSAATVLLTLVTLYASPPMTLKQTQVIEALYRRLLTKPQ